MLTRHANMLLAFALPLALLMPRPTRTWRLASVALLVGIASIVAARLGTTALCELGGRDYYPRVGFTFLWRLPFLNTLPEPARTKVLDQASANARTEDARLMIGLLRQMLQEGVPLEKGTVFPRSRELFLQMGRKGVVKRHQFALNEMARAFLTPPSAELVDVARSDFARARTMPLADTTRSLFMTTAMFFDRPTELPLLAPLRTYHERTRESLLSIYEGNRYLHLLSSISLNRALIVWLMIAGALIVWRRSRGNQSVRVVAFSAALIAMALGMIAATCLLGELLPRYTLPAWVLLWAALIMTVGEIGKSAGRLESQVKLPGGPSSLPPESVTPPGSTRAAS